MTRVPLHPEQPPRNLPRLSLTWRSLTDEPLVETMFQSVSLSKFLDQLNQSAGLWLVGHQTTYPPTMWTLSRFSLCGPASIRSTLFFGSSASRAATTQPEVPPLHGLAERLRLTVTDYSPADDKVIDFRAGHVWSWRW